MNKNTIGEKIKCFRKVKGVTQSELAEALGYKDKSMIAHIEKGDADMTYEKIALMVRKYKIDANELFDERNCEHKKKTEIPTKIGTFKLDTSRPTTMHFGYLYTLEVTPPFDLDEKSMIRVWLPEDYEFDNKNKRFPVLYMADGQNLVNEHTSAFGEWKMDRIIHRLMREGYPSIIIVGYDSPKDSLKRTLELCPPYVPRPEIALDEGGSLANTYGDKYVNAVVNNGKPFIDFLFHTLPGKEYTGIGGSSMGGLMSFYAAVYRPEIFGFCLSFSPAFFFYKESDMFNIFQSLKLSSETMGKVFLYCGGKGFENRFLEPVIKVYHYLVRDGFNSDHAALVVDTTAEHNEEAWSKIAPQAIKFWLDGLKIW